MVGLFLSRSLSSQLIWNYSCCKTWLFQASWFQLRSKNNCEIRKNQEINILCCFSAFILFFFLTLYNKFKSKSMTQLQIIIFAFLLLFAPANSLVHNFPGLYLGNSFPIQTRFRCGAWMDHKISQVHTTSTKPGGKHSQELLNLVLVSTTSRLAWMHSSATKLNYRPRPLLGI